MRTHSLVRRSALFFLACLCLAGLCACSASGQDPLLGLWEADRVESGGRSIPFSQYEEEYSYVAFTLEFKEEGKLIAESGGVPAEGVYTVGDGMVTIDFGSGEWTLDFDGTELVWEQLGVKIIMTHTK